MRNLQTEGVIGTKPAEMGDGHPTFLPMKPVTFHGLTALSVEGWNYKERMFARGLGTAPPVQVGIIVGGGEQEVREELTRNGIILAPNAEGKPLLYTTDGDYVDLRLASKYRGKKLTKIICSL
ncbi:hypothetical protein [Methylobacterium trifolii]|uniref:hypothetical protein n=1 Tax=Methylobacterium trifolii TaxID=1003092 RepID=UPI001EDF7A14|nr:hypothetical protein [Methylobacterium trifolii]